MARSQPRWECDHREFTSRNVHQPQVEATTPWKGISERCTLGLLVNGRITCTLGAGGTMMGRAGLEMSENVILRELLEMMW